MAEGDGAVPSQVEIRCGCAFTYVNAVFRKNLTEALAINANDRTLRSAQAAHSTVSPASRCLAGQS